jgi:SAM-dependent methyltransferase
MPVYNERYLVAECVRRALAVEDDKIGRLELIIVDDGSTDGTREILRELAADHPDRITYVEHERNQGKGAAVRTGVARARGDVTVVQDADLEYDPHDLPKLMVPFLQEQADAVYGSRFLSGPYRRVLYYRHTLGNKLLTFLTNVLTDLNLTDMETCYKAVRTPLLQSIPIRSNDFRLEVELTFKLAKREARMFEVPISYAGRSYAEGKKIGAKDGFLALFAMLRWWLIDDIYDEVRYGSNILVALSEAPKFNNWMGDTIRPHVGGKVLEIGAGIGNITNDLLPRDLYTATDIDDHYLEHLTSMAQGRPFMNVRRVDLAEPGDFADLDGRYDTVVCLNVLEHVADERRAVENLHSALEPGGAAVVLVPQDPRLYGTLDKVLGHERRYTRETLQKALEQGGFQVEQMLEFNRISVPAWWFSGRVLKRRHLGRLQLKLLDSVMWLVRRIDRFLPWSGTSLIAVARRS